MHHRRTDSEVDSGISPLSPLEEAQGELGHDPQGVREVKARDFEVRDLPEIWRKVPDFPVLSKDGILWVSNHGSVKVIYPDGSVRFPKIGMRTHGPSSRTIELRIAYVPKIGKANKISIARLVYRAFVGKVEGYTIVHRNMVKTDNSPDNLIAIKSEECGRYGGAWKGKRVAKIDRDGNILEWYKDITEAAEKNYYSSMAVSNRCAHKCKFNRVDEFENGFSFRWADDI